VSDWRTVQRIHRASIRKFIWISDLENHGTIEYYVSNDEVPPIDEIFYEDCDGYAYAIYWRCLDEGVRGWVAFVRVRPRDRKSGHLIYLNKGWVADNRYRDLRWWGDLTYEWLSYGRPDGTWYEFNL